MSQHQVSISLPLDPQGFLRRECPHCEQQFKWHQTPEGQVAAVVPSEEGYYCPYCGRQAGAGQWWTPEQLDFARQTATAEIVGPMLNDFADSVNSASRPGGLVRISATVPQIDSPAPLVEANDMIRIDFACHPSEPVKVAVAHSGPIHCLICGQPDNH